MAEGVKNTVSMLSGKKEIYTLCAYEQTDNIETEINELCQKLDMKQKTIVFTDLLGGSVNLEITRNMMSNTVMIVAGFNLAVILECLYLSDEECNEQTLLGIINSAKEQMVLVNAALKKERGM